MSELRPCPSCDSTNIRRSFADVMRFECDSCGMSGPVHDVDGAEWNALPRRSDTEALRNELIGVLTQIKTSDIGGRYAGIGKRIDELVKEGL